MRVDVLKHNSELLYYVDFAVEFFEPKTSYIRSITMREILLEQDLIGKDIANKKEIEFFGKFTDEIERKLHETYFLLKYCKKYLEGDFSLVEKE